MDQIHHFLHSHPLMLTKGEEVSDEVVCSGCEKLLAGPNYVCRGCKFYLHKSCAGLPREIQNFFHPCPLVLNIRTVYICNACYQFDYGFSYYCGKCNFNMQVKCALRPTIKSQGVELIHHFTHWHPLTLVDQEKFLKVQCCMCDKLCSGSSNSFESAYGCEECKFVLHNSCMMNIPRQINHLFHPSCPLILLTVDSYKCDGCDEDCSGLTFGCGKCYFHLDAKCALLPTVESEGADKIQHPAHRHPLALRENMEFDNEVRCIACEENCLGSCFVCERCHFFLHKPCAKEFPQEIHHPFHPLHPLILCHSTGGNQIFRCLACGGLVDMLMIIYFCAKCHIGIHIDCAVKSKLKTLIKYGGHSHTLTFFDKTRDAFGCDICRKKAQNCFFRCVACDFDIHLYCLPSAPKTIKHKYHLHPLTLTTSPFQFELTSPQYRDDSDDDDDDEFYCDVCEEKRYKFESVYYCGECRFTAEVRCVISELLPSLIISEDPSTGRAISQVEEISGIEATIAKQNNEIAEIRAKKNPLEVEIEKLRAMFQALEIERTRD